MKGAKGILAGVAPPPPGCGAIKGSARARTASFWAPNSVISWRIFVSLVLVLDVSSRSDWTPIAPQRAAKHLALTTMPRPDDQRAILSSLPLEVCWRPNTDGALQQQLLHRLDEIDSSQTYIHSDVPADLICMIVQMLPMVCVGLPV